MAAVPGWRKCNCCGTFTTQIVAFSGLGAGATHAETYSPDTWTATANPTHPTAAFGDCSVTGAAIMAYVSTSLVHSDAWISGGWNAESNMPVSGIQFPQQGPSTITGTVGWVYGGFNVNTSNDITGNYQSNVSTWSTNTAMTASKARGRGATIGATSKSYAFMGTTGNFPQTQTATGYEYDNVGDVWATSASGSQTRRDFGSFALDSVPAIFCVGGTDNSMTYTLNEEFSGGSFTTKTAYSFAAQVPRGDQVTSLSAGYMTGGNNSGSPVNSVNEYVIDTWTSKTGMTNARASHGASAF